MLVKIALVGPPSPRLVCTKQFVFYPNNFRIKFSILDHCVRKAVRHNRASDNLTSLSRWPVIKLSFRNYLESQNSSLLTTIHKVGAIFNQVWLSNSNIMSCEESAIFFQILQLSPILIACPSGPTIQTVSMKKTQKTPWTIRFYLDTSGPNFIGYFMKVEFFLNIWLIHCIN